MFVGRVLSIAPDPVLLAERLHASGAERVALLHAADRSPGPWSRFSYVAADPDRESHQTDPLLDDPNFDPDKVPTTFRDLPRWIGVLPYDAYRHLERPAWSKPDVRPPALMERPLWLRYPAVVVVDHLEGRVLVVGTGAAQVETLVAKLKPRAIEKKPLVVHVFDHEPTSRHLERILAAKALIEAGDLYQVNLARKLRVLLESGSVIDLYRRLSAAAPTPFAACLQLEPDLFVVSTSPELLLRAEAKPGAAPGVLGRLFTCPIKGTRPRGKDAREDAALVHELDKDPKENAELTMIVDVERNDLGKVAAIGSVEVLHGPSVVTHKTVHHREALLGAWVRSGLSRQDVLASMVPSGSVTGAPKRRAMEVIADLEPARRGLYTGGFGFVAQDGSVTLAMAIRTAVLRGNEGEYFTGGGIVFGSDPDRELLETRWKAVQLEKTTTGRSTE